MNKLDSPSDEKWIHSFAVTDVCLHPKKFTVYKITSVVRAITNTKNIVNLIKSIFLLNHLLRFRYFQ